MSDDGPAGVISEDGSPPRVRQESEDELRRRVTASQIDAGRPPPRPSALLFAAVDGSTISVRPELLSEIRESFAMFGDGDRMNVQHLHKALRSMGVNVMDADVMAVAERYNVNGRDHIDCDQWTAAVVERLAQDWDRRERFRDLLEAADGRGTRLVPVDHVRTVFKSFGDSLTAADADDMVASTEHAGYVDIDEFMGTMLRPARVIRFV